MNNDNYKSVNFQQKNAETDDFLKCYRCFRPKKTCYCQYIKNFDCGIKFVFLMHPKEAYKQKTGTGRLAHLTLDDSEILIGVDFTGDKRLNELLNDEQYFCVLLFPDENAFTASSLELKRNIVGNTDIKKKLLVIVVDSTWFFAKKILRLSKNLDAIPKISFQGDYRSQFLFKTQPNEKCVSSIESCYYLIEELKQNKCIPQVDAQPLMQIFLRMVNFQLQSEQERIARGEKNRYSR